MNKYVRLLALGFLVFILNGGSVAQSETLDLSEYKGKVVYLDFWASWCAPCKESFPWLNKLKDKPGMGDLVVIGVNLDNERVDADKFLKETPAKFKLVFDPKGELATKYSVEGMPYAVLIDRDGTIIHKHIGFNPAKVGEYESQIKSAIEAKKLDTKSDEKPKAKQ
jgi:cytochrome c biogenesis protein CcmG, thiol:disulfide interchange protein DsbE